MAEDPHTNPEKRPEYTLELEPLVADVLACLPGKLKAEKFGQLGVELQLPTDEDPMLKEAWVAGVRESVNHDLSDFIRLIEVDLNSEKHTLKLTPQHLEPSLRAATAIRQKLHETTLADIPETALQAGEIGAFLNRPELQEDLLLYLVLASFQEKIIEVLNPDMG